MIAGLGALPLADRERAVVIFRWLDVGVMSDDALERQSRNKGVNAARRNMAKAEIARRAALESDEVST